MSQNTQTRLLNDLSVFLDVAFKFGVIVGGTILLTYCVRIGFFPSDLSIGDGFLFIIIAVAFSFLYLFFIGCITSAGIILGPVWHCSQSVFIKLLRTFGKAQGYTPFTIEKKQTWVYIPGLLGFLLAYGLFKSDHSFFLPLLFCAWATALLMSTFLQNGRKIEALEALVERPAEQSQTLSTLKKCQLPLILFGLLTPLVFNTVVSRLADATMRIIQVRNDNVTLHIEQPYDILALEYKVALKPSGFGDNFRSIEHANILLKGLGSTILVETLNKEGVLIKLQLPSDHVHIITH